MSTKVIPIERHSYDPKNDDEKAKHPREDVSPNSDTESKSDLIESEQDAYQDIAVENPDDTITAPVYEQIARLRKRNAQLRDEVYEKDLEIDRLKQYYNVKIEKLKNENEIGHIQREALRYEYDNKTKGALIPPMFYSIDHFDWGHHELKTKLIGDGFRFFHDIVNIPIEFFDKKDSDGKQKYSGKEIAIIMNQLCKLGIYPADRVRNNQRISALKLTRKLYKRLKALGILTLQDAYMAWGKLRTALKESEFAELEKKYNALNIQYD